MKAFFASLVLLVGMDLVANEIYDCDESGCYSDVDYSEDKRPEIAHERGDEFDRSEHPIVRREVYRPLRPTFCWEDLLFGRGFCAYFGGFAPEPPPETDRCADKCGR
jgi:hypothetical protein